MSEHGAERRVRDRLRLTSEHPYMRTRHDDDVAAVLAELDALRKRVAELEGGGREPETVDELVEACDHVALRVGIGIWSWCHEDGGTVAIEVCGIDDERTALRALHAALKVLADAEVGRGCKRLQAMLTKAES